MKNQKRLVFATNNAHKLEEARRIIGDSFEIVSLSDIGCHDDIPETGKTLEENAFIKARWVKERYGYDCFSDDTGLMVDALNGAPGVYSARYAGESCNSADNVAKLLEELKDVEDRRAHFSTAIALIADGEEHMFEGRVDGSIAREPHGAGGFGYDPVFIAEESGRRFAEMSAEEKNSISHRGRAMRRLRDFLATMVTCLLLMLIPFGAHAQQWRMHSSYDGQMERIIDTPKQVYFLGTAQDYDGANAYKSTLYGTLMKYDKNDEEMTVLTSTNALSDNTPVAVEYNFDKKYLVIAYANGNIDLLYDDGKVKNVPGLKMAEGSQSKLVNSIRIDNATNSIYLSTDFGYVTVDDAKSTIGTSRIYNKKVTATGDYDGKLWVACDGKIYYGDSRSLSLDDMTPFADIKDVVRMEHLKGRGLFVLHGRRNQMQCTVISLNEDGEYVAKLNSIETERSMERTTKGLALWGNTTLRLLHEDRQDIWTGIPKEDYGKVGSTYNESDAWISSGRKGICRKKISKENNNWTVLNDNFFPNVSSAFMCTSMGYSPEFGVLVRNHSLDHNFNTESFNFLNTKDLISAYKDMNWKQVSTTYLLPDSKGLEFYDPRGVAIDPNNPNHVYSGSVLTGLLRLDLKNPEKSLHFSMPADWTGGAGQPGFVSAVENSPDDAAWKDKCLFSVPKFDSNGTMWTMFVSSLPNYPGSDHVELWYWTAQDRAASTNEKNFRPFKKIEIKNSEVSNNPIILPLTVNKNMIVVAGNTKGEPIIVYDHNGTLDTRADDRIARMLTIYDQDGSNVPFDYGFSFFEDPTTGVVWVGTNRGIFTFDPKEVFSNPQQVRRIKVPRNDGTNLADYLLDGVGINQIMSDASGNKWFATRGGGLTCTSADGKEVLYSYSTQNSPIPGDNVYSICFNPDTNSIMISTDAGLCEMFLTGTVADASRSVRIFPNPARPDYHGYVTIDGLESDAFVKIVDTVGAVMKELGQAQLGTVEWDLTDYAHKRVPGGVYFVLATNSPESDKYIKMGKILVVE